jgi:hypothetical protein
MKQLLMILEFDFPLLFRLQLSQYEYLMGHLHLVLLLARGSMTIIILLSVCSVVAPLL